MLDRMVVAARAHAGSWSEEDLVDLPEDGRLCELVEGSLLVNPPPGGVHQLVSWELARLLKAAVSSDMVVVENLGVRLPDDTMFIPDVLVAERTAVLANRSGILDLHVVALVVEIVSPGSRTMDRLTKPALYARAGIPYFWRVELEGDRGVFAFRLEEGAYAEMAAARSGEELVVDEPFSISLDPGDLWP